MAERPHTDIDRALHTMNYGSTDKKWAVKSIRPIACAYPCGRRMEKQKTKGVRDPIIQLKCQESHVPRFDQDD